MQTDDPIEAGWFEYLERCIPRHADDAEVLLTRLAFYSGCAAMLSTIGRQGLSLSWADEQKLQDLGEKLADAASHAAEWGRTLCAR
jgi:hypothetical protein